MEFANNDTIFGHNLARISQERKCRPIQLHNPTAYMCRRLPQNPKPFLNVKPMISQPAVVETKQSKKTHNNTEQTNTQGHNTLLTMTLRQQHNNTFMLKDSVRSIKLLSKQQWHSF
jgi:hypothetical protein